MTCTNARGRPLADEIEDLKRQVAALTDRVLELEGDIGGVRLDVDGALDVLSDPAAPVA